MASMRKLIGCLLLLLASSVMVSVMIALSSIAPNCPQTLDYRTNGDSSWGKHHLAVIVPYRDRFEELLQFVPYMHTFLNEQKIRHTIYIINQVDKLRFNRASLINVGHLLSRPICDYLVMHDVDLLPLNSKLSYSYPEKGPFHVASPDLHPKYHYSTFVGGILILTREQFELVNGLSNRYWGWGLEDDEFFARMKDAKLNISRPQNIKSGIHNTFKHLHDRSVRRRDTARLYNQKEATRKRDRVTGLADVQYELISTQHITIDSAPIVLHNVKLICDYTKTPWCDKRSDNTKKTM